MRWLTARAAAWSKTARTKPRKSGLSCAHVAVPGWCRRSSRPDTIAAKGCEMAGLSPGHFPLALGRASRCLFRFAVAARGRRLDDDRLAGVDHGGIRALERIDPSVVAAHGVLADLTGFAPGQAERAHAPSARHDLSSPLFLEATLPTHARAP